MEMYNLPISAETKRYIVHMCKDSMFGSYIVCDKVVMGEGVYVLVNAIFEEKITGYAQYRIVDTRHYSARQRFEGVYPLIDPTQEVEMSFGCRCVQMVVPIALVLNVVALADLGDFPQTQAWSSRTRQDAEAALEIEKAKADEQAIAVNAASMPDIEAVYKAKYAYKCACKAWSELSIWRRLKWIRIGHKAEDVFTDHYVARNKTDFSLLPLHRFLHDFKVEW
jgi:hypothetical protein